jgi:bifunctional ADP-heptose synthase (sugar kinase/adenylyltransferase)
MRLLVIGDYIEDRYVFGTATRLCPEAPVPVIVPHEWKMSWGGAGLVCNQLAELSSGEVQPRFMSYSLKERFFAGNHLICRVDSDNSQPPQHLLMPFGTDDLEHFDAFIICDYSKGALNQECAHLIVETDKPCFVDAKNHWPWYEGENVTIFPNHLEATPVVEFPANIDGGYYMGSRQCVYGRIVSKWGKDGCRLNDSEHKDYVIPATVSEVVDVCGAGDIFMAAFVYAWSIQLPSDHCLQFANELAGESCRHIGTHVVSRAFAESVLDRLRVSPESAAQAPDCSPGSSNTRLQPPVQPGQSFSEWSQRADNLAANSLLGEVVTGGILNTPPLGQILHRSPSSPTAPHGAPAPSDQETADEQDRRLR